MVDKHIKRSVFLRKEQSDWLNKKYPQRASILIRQLLDDFILHN